MPGRETFATSPHNRASKNYGYLNGPPSTGCGRQRTTVVANVLAHVRDQHGP